jgi:hypothetical protein
LTNCNAGFTEGVFINDVVEIGLGAIRSFIKIGCGILKLIVGGNTDTQTHIEEGDLTSLPLFFSK